MSLPASAAIPAPHRDRQESAYETGRQIVEMIRHDRKPSDILTRNSFINAIRVNSALGGSTNAPLHLIALALTDARSARTAAQPGSRMNGSSALLHGR